jgi:prepilin-type N-terminal cleavage/methylation domain-containing protein
MKASRTQDPVILAAQPSEVRAFTLVELLVAVAIGLIILGLAIPTLREGLRPPIAQATKDFLDASQHARSRAIMESRTMQIAIRNAGRELTVEEAPEGVLGAANGVSPTSFKDPGFLGSAPSFSREFPEEVLYERIDVNTLSFLQSPATAIRFYPNGTSDQFAAVITWRRTEPRLLTIDMMTGLAEAKALP